MKEWYYIEDLLAKEVQEVKEDMIREVDMEDFKTRRNMCTRIRKHLYKEVIANLGEQYLLVVESSVEELVVYIIETKDVEVLKRDSSIEMNNVICDSRSFVYEY